MCVALHLCHGSSPQRGLRFISSSAGSALVVVWRLSRKLSTDPSPIFFIPFLKGWTARSPNPLDDGWNGRSSGVTPMGSGWANPRAPGPFTLVFQLRLPFQKGAPVQHLFHSVVAKFPCMHSINWWNQNHLGAPRGQQLVSCGGGGLHKWIFKKVPLSNLFS